MKVLKMHRLCYLILLYIEGYDKKSITFLYILDFCKFLFDSNATQSTKFI